MTNFPDDFLPWCKLVSSATTGQLVDAECDLAVLLANVKDELKRRDAIKLAKDAERYRMEDRALVGFALVQAGNIFTGRPHKPNEDLREPTAKTCRDKTKSLTDSEFNGLFE